MLAKHMKCKPVVIQVFTHGNDLDHFLQTMVVDRKHSTFLWRNSFYIFACDLAIDFFPKYDKFWQPSKVISDQLPCASMTINLNLHRTDIHR